MDSMTAFCRRCERLTPRTRTPCSRPATPSTKPARTVISRTGIRRNRAQNKKPWQETYRPPSRERAMRQTLRNAMLSAAVLVAAVLTLSAQNTAPAKTAPAWVERSNEHTRWLLLEQAKLSPEGAAAVGVDGFDEQITMLTADRSARVRESLVRGDQELQRRLSAEKDPLVRQDLEILLDANRQGLQSFDLGQRLLLPYFSAPQSIFGGLRGLLDDQVPAERRRAALVRLRKYTGTEAGFTPFTQLALERLRERLKQKELLGPFRDQVERDLSNIPVFTSGLADLFKKYGLTEAEPLLATLKTQFSDYERAVRAEILPRTRTDFKLPPELYAIGLKQYGVDIQPEELVTMAHRAYDEIQKEMQAIAADIARDQKSSDSDYRSVIRNLKKQQLVGDAILPHYQQRLKQLEEIIRTRNLATLPERPARIRIASAAESAQQPAPNMRPPRLIDNRGEQGEFILPLNIPSADPALSKRYDDFTFEAASWTLTAHEARPGHELQFAAMIEHGVSQARAIYAFNSTNVEGWGLYAEYIMKPFMPREGQLISLQHRLLRAARAFSDPELQMGSTTPERVKKLLMDDVVLSDAMATQEVERYTFRAPGQATSYFYGYSRLLALRSDVEKTLAARFDARQFHDFVLAQGLLPPRLLRKAVMEEFVETKK